MPVMRLGMLGTSPWVCPALKPRTAEHSPQFLPFPGNLYHQNVSEQRRFFYPQGVWRIIMLLITARRGFFCLIRLPSTKHANEKQGRKNSIHSERPLLFNWTHPYLWNLWIECHSSCVFFKVCIVYFVLGVFYDWSFSIAVRQFNSSVMLQCPEVQGHWG